MLQDTGLADHVLIADARSVALVKLASNVFLAMKVAYAFGGPKTQTPTIVVRADPPYGFKGPVMAPAPIGASLNANDSPVRLPTASSVRTACGVTSWPTPSPGNTAIR